MPSPCLVVMRHGERLDYTTRDAGGNWQASAARPWDPPLTAHGVEQARLAGERIEALCAEHDLLPPKHFYSSPLKRCAETLSGTLLPGVVRIENGLVESVNEDWYRSWCCPGSDGTWGGPNGKRTGTPIDEKSLHVSSG